MKKLILIIDKPEHCFQCDLEDNNYCIIKGKRCESLGRPAWCPLCEYERVIPVGWFKYWLEYNGSKLREQTVIKIVNDWKKRNEEWSVENEGSQSVEKDNLD